MQKALLPESKASISHTAMRLQPNTLKQTVILGTFFLLLVTTYISFSNIITFIFEREQSQFSFLGGLTLILNYTVYLIGLTYAATLKNFKRQFQIAAITYTVSYIVFIPDFDGALLLIVAIIGALVGGYGASVLWVSQGGYMVKLFRRYKISENDEGRYMGIQSGLIYGQVILGGAITTFALGLFGNTVYFIVLSIIGILSFLFVHFFLDPLEELPVSQIESIETPQELEKRGTFWSELKKVLLYYPKMKFMVPAMVLDGILLAFTTTNFSNLVRKQLATDFNIGMLHISNGVGAIIGGYLSGWLSSRITALRQGILLFSFTAFTMLLTTINGLYTFQELYYPLFTTFLWGICLYFLEGWLFVACVKLYDGHIQSFAVVKQIHTISFILFQLFSLLYNQNVPFLPTILFILALALLCAVTCVYLVCRSCYTKVEDRPLEEPPNHQT